MSRWYREEARNGVEEAAARKAAWRSARRMKHGWRSWRRKRAAAAAKRRQRESINRHSNLKPERKAYQSAALPQHTARSIARAARWQPGYKYIS